jgi:hypothetical protein
VNLLNEDASGTYCSSSENEYCLHDFSSMNYDSRRNGGLSMRGRFIHLVTSTPVRVGSKGKPLEILMSSVPITM